MTAARERWQMRTMSIRLPPTCATSGPSPRKAWSEAHFATFPEALVIPCIKAGTSEKGVCAACGAPWVREVSGAVADFRGGGYQRGATLGWHPSCTCREPIFGAPVTRTRPCTVLDCFAGAGTVGLVADKLGRDAILIEISEDYADMAQRRIQDAAPLFTELV